ncbi:hypothetical protein [Pseudonocardia sp. TRM90224]|uniref:hypothetical protein n=1 Tax=Pseudonocardia sp. TRM90224 TaxID=2812678 RepID=UPI001E55B8AE|nr:hypothetical protein [Pseudonocardia sp. TRM90224]
MTLKIGYARICAMYGPDDVRGVDEDHREQCAGDEILDVAGPWTAPSTAGRGAHAATSEGPSEMVTGGPS